MLLALEIAQRCADEIKAWVQSGNKIDEKMAEELKPEHLLWMCEKIEKNHDEWPETKLHRHVGYIQASMIAIGISNLAHQKELVRNAKIAFQEEFDVELENHNDPNNPFEFDIGGESG